MIRQRHATLKISNDRLIRLMDVSCVFSSIRVVSFVISLRFSPPNSLERGPKFFH
jgi:hypothetical protein